MDLLFPHGILVSIGCNFNGIFVPLTKSVVLGAPQIDQCYSLIPSFRLQPKDPITTF